MGLFADFAVGYFSVRRKQINSIMTVSWAPKKKQNLGRVPMLQFKSVESSIINLQRKNTQNRAKPRNVLFVSFSDSEKEIGCGTKSHCYSIRIEKATLLNR